MQPTDAFIFESPRSQTRTAILLFLSGIALFVVVLGLMALLALPRGDAAKSDRPPVAPIGLAIVGVALISAAIMKVRHSQRIALTRAGLQPIDRDRVLLANGAEDTALVYVVPQLCVGPLCVANMRVLAGVEGLLGTDFLKAAHDKPGTLNVGTNSIVLSPVPYGVNGSNTNHYLYISGGTGAAEAVPITGGSAVSGAASGSIYVTCANAHSGAWTIATATGGIQEAIYFAGPLN